MVAIVQPSAVLQCAARIEAKEIGFADCPERARNGLIRIHEVRKFEAMGFGESRHLVRGVGRVGGIIIRHDRRDTHALSFKCVQVRREPVGDADNIGAMIADERDQ